MVDQKSRNRMNITTQITTATVMKFYIQLK